MVVGVIVGVMLKRLVCMCIVSKGRRCKLRSKGLEGKYTKWAIKGYVLLVV